MFFGHLDLLMGKPDFAALQRNLGTSWQPTAGRGKPTRIAVAAGFTPLFGKPTPGPNSSGPIARSAPLVVKPAARIGMLSKPVVRYVDAPGDPYAIVLHHVVEQAFQTDRASRVADQAHVEANRHHLRLRRALTMKNSSPRP